MVRQYPIQLPLQPPKEAYIDPSTFTGSITSSRCYHERTKGIDGRWASLNKSQNTVLTKLRCVVEEIDKLGAKTTDNDSLMFCYELSNYLVSIMPHIASMNPGTNNNRNNQVVLPPKTSTDSITKHLLKQ